MPDAPSLLALDAGNSAVKGGLFAGERLVRTFRIALTRHDPPERWEAALREQLAGTPPVPVGLASVVPEVAAVLEAYFRRAGVVPVAIGTALRLPFRIAYETPHTLGADRLAAAAAAWLRYSGAPAAPRAVVALDAGTAVTYEVLDRLGVYWGGAIAPGPVLLERALHTGTAQLPPVPLALPPQPVGRSTRGALQAGILYGFVDGVRGMLDRLVAYLGEPPVVVATGGWAPFLEEHVAAIETVDPHLVLHGIRLLIEGK